MISRVHVFKIQYPSQLWMIVCVVAPSESYQSKESKGVALKQKPLFVWSIILFPAAGLCNLISTLYTGGYWVDIKIAISTFYYSAVWNYGYIASVRSVLCVVHVLFTFLVLVIASLSRYLDLSFFRLANACSEISYDPKERLCVCYDCFYRSLMSQVLYFRRLDFECDWCISTLSCRNSERFLGRGHFED